MKQSHPTVEQLEAFRQRVLPAQSLNEVSRHICECDECRDQLESSAQATPSAPALGKPFLVTRAQHLQYDDLQVAVDSITLLTTAQQAHLAACAMCRREYEELSAFAATLNDTPRATTKWQRLALYAAAAVVLLSAGVFTLRHAFPGTSMVAELHDSGASIGIDSQGQLHGPASLSADDRRILVAALQSHRLATPPKPAPASSSDQQVFRGAAQGSPAFFVLSPQRESLYTATPSFRWQPLAGALSYRVNIYDRAFHRVSQSPPLTDANWTPTEPLQRGQSYTWDVEASVPGDIIRAPHAPDSEARFDILSDADAAGIRTALQQNPNAHLLLAARYAQAGARDEARIELNRLQAENPRVPMVRELEKSLDSPTAQAR